MPFSLTNTAAMALPPLPDWISKHQERMQLLLPQISVGTAPREEEQMPAMTTNRRGTSYEVQQGGFQLHNRESSSP